MPSISVVIPLFNKEAHIKRAIESVRSQTLSPIEILVIDDGSTDKGLEIVSRIRDLCIQSIHQQNAGVSVARNRGIEKAKGEYIAFLDADDVWKPIHLETISKLISQYPEAGAFATNYEIVTSKGSRLPRLNALPPFPWEGIIPSYFRSAALGEPPVTSSSVCIPKHVLIQTGCFPVGKRMGEDLDLWGRVALQYPIAFSSLIGASYHHDADNRTCMSFTQGDEHPFCSSAVKWLKASGLPPHMAEDIELYVSRLKIENMRQHVLSGNYKRARELAAEVRPSAFPVRRLLWGSRLNFITRMLWNYRYPGRLKTTSI